MNNNIDFPSKDSYLLINGNVGNIELLVAPNKDNKTIHVPELIAIICHPHPLHEGTMNNKVVYTAHKAFTDHGCSTIRFNFRGVGRSEGIHDNSIGETDDLITIIDWIKQQKPNSKIILSGFSFGAFIALKASKSRDCTQIISIAPAVHHQDYSSLLPIETPWLVIMGDKDEIVPPKLVFDWIDSLDKQPKLIKFKESGHFFHGKLPDLKLAIINHLKIL